MYHVTCALHTCDNPPCCNPAHLFLGDDVDNVADREAKGRGRASFGVDHYMHRCPSLIRRGVDASQAKLSEEDVRSIRADERTMYCIAKERGVAFNTIKRVKLRMTYAEIS